MLLSRWGRLRARRTPPVARRAFRAWRGCRPFAGGLLTALAGLAILWAPLSVVVVQGLAGVASLVIAALLIGMGALSWFQPQLCPVLGLVSVVLALASLLTSNLGGFGLGALLGLVGGSLVFAWTPAPLPPVEEEPGRRGPAQIATVVAVSMLAAGAGVLAAPGQADAQAALPVVATAPASLVAEVVTMSKVAYRGVVEVPTADGPVRALRFEMESLTLIGTVLSARGAPTLRNLRGAATLGGGVDLYVSRIAGLLFGVLPVVFTPSRPPPLVPPAATLTVAEVEVVYLRADLVKLPSLHQFVTDA
jgi:hypothetical protein